MEFRWHIWLFQRFDCRRERAAEVLQNPDLTLALVRLKCKPERTKVFIELLDAFGSTLIENIVAAHEIVPV